MKSDLLIGLFLFIEKSLRLGANLLVAVLLVRFNNNAYGPYIYVLSLVAVVQELVKFGMDNVLVNEIIKSKRKGCTLCNAVWIKRFLGLIFYSGALLAWCVFVGIGWKQLLYFGLAEAVVVFQSWEVYDSYLQANKKTKALAILKMFIYIIFICVKSIIIVTNISIELLLVTNALESLVLMCVLKKQCGIQCNTFKLKKFCDESAEIFKKSLPLAITGVLVIVYSKIDLWIIKSYLSFDDLAAYSAVTQVSLAFGTVPTALIGALNPKLLKLWHDKDTGFSEFYGNTKKILFITTGIYIAIVMLFAESIIYILYGDKYVDYSFLLRIHVLGCVGVSISMIQTPWLIVHNINNIRVIQTSIGSVISIILNLFFIRTYGLFAVATVSVIVFISVSLIPYLVSSKMRHELLCRY